MSGLLFLIPARGGSRRIPDKNLRPLAGIPLVGWAARIARLAAGAIDGGPHRVVCSTDDETIAEAARTWGAEVLDRPPELATDDATSVDVALHALEALAGRSAFRALVLLQPTSPLTDPADVRAAVERFDSADGAGVVSVTSAHPAGFHVSVRDGRVLPVDEEALGDSSWQLSGAFYVVAPDDLRRDRRFVVEGRTLAVQVPVERSVDIDEPADLAMAEAAVEAMPARLLSIGGRSIGGGDVFVIAEAGVNHDGDPHVAHALIDAAADAGADAVKFQTFDPDALVAVGAPTAEYQRAAGEGEDQRSMLARLALPKDAWAPLQAHAAERGLVFLSTPFDDESAALLDALAVPAFKVGSGELTNLPFLARLAERGRPMLVSTGMAEMVEVAAAVDAIRAAGNDDLALLHCVSVYPADPADANLRAMTTMRRAFGVPTGWSDHTPGTELAMAATALGASIIEKHLTLDRSRSGPDHASSLEPGAFRSLVLGIRTATAALGDGVKRPVDAERPIAAVARRSLHWARDLQPGELATAADVAAVRPGTGIAPAAIDHIVGRVVRRPVRAGAAVAWDDFEETP